MALLKTTLISLTGAIIVLAIIGANAPAGNVSQPDKQFQIIKMDGKTIIRREKDGVVCIATITDSGVGTDEECH